MKQAVILAAGEGQRLRPFTVTKPKTMLAIAGKPILQCVVEALAQNGIRNIVIVVGYRREQVFNYIGDGERFGVKVVYITQDKQLGTAHALLQARSVVEDEFLVLPGDNLIDANTIARFVSVRPDAVLVKKVQNPGRYGVVTIEDDTVRAIVEKPREAEGDIVNTGIYAFSRKVFGYIDSEPGIPDAINRMVASGRPVSAQETEDTWLDIIYPWDILSSNDVILRQLSPSLGGTIESGASVKGPVSIGKGTLIRSNSYIVGPVVIGANCDIGPGVCVFPSTSIGDNVLIAPFSVIENCVIRDDVHIGAASIMRDSVIDESCHMGGHFSACSGEVDIQVNDEHHTVTVGAMLGVGCNLRSNVVVQPGTVIGNYSQVQAMKVLSGRLPDRSVVY